MGKTTYYLIGDSKITDHLSAKTRLYYDTYYNVLDAYDNANFTTQNLGRAFHSTFDDYATGGSLVRSEQTYIPRNILSFAFHYKEDVHQEQDNPNLPWERYEGKLFSYGLEDNIKITESLGLCLGGNYDVQKTKYNNGGTLRDDDDAFNGSWGPCLYFRGCDQGPRLCCQQDPFPHP